MNGGTASHSFMATIQFAVIVKQDPEPSRGFSVEHLYQHRADALACAAKYISQLKQLAIVMTLAPPLSVVRAADTWVSPDYVAAQLSVIDEASGSALCAPIRQAMPVQRGVPQFRGEGGGNGTSGGR